MCSGLTKVYADAVMDASSKIWSKHGWNNADDVQHSVLACELLDEVPGITTLEASELDQLTDQNFHTEVTVITNLQKEYQLFLKVEKEVEFKKWFGKC